MRIDSAKTTLKVLGIIAIIFGVLGIIASIGLIAGTEMVGKDLFTSSVMNQAGVEDAATAVGIVMVLGAIMLISALVDLLLGIFSVRASNDFNKIMPAYVLSIISLIMSVATMIISFAGGSVLSAILDSIASIVFSAVIFIAAKTIKNEVR